MNLEPHTNPMTANSHPETLTHDRFPFPALFSPDIAVNRTIAARRPFSQPSCNDK